jgi:hypothetical protein
VLFKAIHSQHWSAHLYSYTGIKFRRWQFLSPFLCTVKEIAYCEILNLRLMCSIDLPSNYPTAGQMVPEWSTLVFQSKNKVVTVLLSSLCCSWCTNGKECLVPLRWLCRLQNHCNGKDKNLCPCCESNLEHSDHTKIIVHAELSYGHWLVARSFGTLAQLLY